MKIALVGVGKIAQAQHVPALQASPHWRLAATVSQEGSVDGVKAYTDFDRFLDENPDIPVVSLCVPPAARFDYAYRALQAGRHIMLEKPPGATLAEVEILSALARQRGLTIYTTWHSRLAHAVAPAKVWLAGKTVSAARIVWKEDVRHWHPGQIWVSQPGGMGVFDTGINAFSILTEILPVPVYLQSASLEVPENWYVPIAARLQFSGNVSAELDWRQTGPQTWDMEIDTDQGELALRLGGNVLEIDGKAVAGQDNIAGEYPALYARMAELVANGESEVDLMPMVHVADALSLGKRTVIPPFDLSSSAHASAVTGPSA